MDIIVRTNGLVGYVALVASLALSLCASPSFATADDFQPLDELPQSSAVGEVVEYESLAHWYSGVEFIFMNVHSSSSGVITASFSDTTAPGVATTAFVDGRGVADYAAASRFWLGRQFNDNWGARVTYFSVGANESRDPHLNPNIPTVGSNFGTFTYTGNTRLSAIDLDVVRSFQISDDWKLDAFGGARYGTFNLATQLYSFGVFTTGNFVNLDLENDAQFAGTGPTFGFSSRNRLYGSDLYLLWGGRGTMLFGQADQFGRASGTVASSPSAPLVGAATARSQDIPSSMGILEAQVGVQYEFRLMDMPYNCFVRCAFEGQYWNVNNKRGGGAGFGGTIGEITTNSFSSFGPGRSTLGGLSLATGFTW